MKDNGLLVQYFTANTTDSQDLWKKAAEDAAVLKKMGATAVWFPPATKGAQGKEDMGYAPYDLYDLGEFDQKGSVGTRYGTKDEYIAAIKAMKDQGINVYADIAVRQKLGADRIEKVTAADFNTKDIPQMIGNKKTVGYDHSLQRPFSHYLILHSAYMPTMSTPDLQHSLSFHNWLSAHLHKVSHLLHKYTFQDQLIQAVL